MQNASPFIIPKFTSESEGEYSLKRETNAGKKYTTAHLSINVIPNPSQQSLSALLISIMIVVAAIISITILIVVLVPICIKAFVKKRQKFASSQFKDEKTESAQNIFSFNKRRQYNKQHKRYPHSRIAESDAYSGYANLEEIQSSTKEYIDLSVKTSVGEYMTIDETSMTQLEPETKAQNTQALYYSNLGHLPSDDRNYEQMKENKEYMEMNRFELHETYTSMSAIKEEEKKFDSKYIPVKEIPVTYKQYVVSGMGNDSLFSIEFRALNGESRENVESASDEARKEINIGKNPMKNILPYDENRVVLESPYFKCNYINASWLENYQFIASIHPTGETLQDFLQMIYQTEASMVIMLTTRKEKAKIIGGVSTRVCYWPKKEEPLKCHPFETSLISSTETNAFVKQEITLKNTLEGKDHSFTLCISPIWNEDSTVVELTRAVALLTRIMKQKQDSPNIPIIIHCTDGISKTGILMTALNSMKELIARESINIFNAVNNLRRQRMNMAPTLVSEINALFLCIRYTCLTVIQAENMRA